jgi:phosphoserine phosphatase
MREYDLICFDVDGTLVEHPDNKVIWEVLNTRILGDDSVNVERFKMYSAGEISYDRWVELDVSGWVEHGAMREQVLGAVSEFNLIDGAMETVRELKNRGYRLAIISGTLDIMIETLFPDHPFEEVFTNKILFDSAGKLVSWEATPFDLHGKPVALRSLVKKFGTTLDRSAFIGDGDNDVPLLGVAGYFVAFNPRSSELEERSDVVIRNRDLRELLEIFK